MISLDISLPTPEENLACDEALLDSSEEGEDEQLLRFWTPASFFIVLGISNVAGREVNLEACRQRGIPVLRRHSGGGCVLQGPGCLNYALILKIPGTGPLTTIAGTNSYVLSRHAGVLSALLGKQVDVMGQSDLTLGMKKFSGNAQRRRQHYLLYHGTFLLSLDIDLLEQLLPFPSRAPAYRRERPHSEFLTNLGLDATALKKALQESWHTSERPGPLPNERIRRLVEERYTRAEWNLRT